MLGFCARLQPLDAGGRQNQVCCVQDYNFLHVKNPTSGIFFPAWEVPRGTWLVGLGKRWVLLTPLVAGRSLCVPLG